MEQTPNLSIPYIMAAQAQKHVTHNEALRALDAVVQLSVRDKDQTTPPPAPENGDRYIVPAEAEGAWAGRTGKIAAWQDNAWMVYTPLEGWLAFVQDEAQLYAYIDSAWQIYAAGLTSVDPVARVGVNTTADATNRLAVKSDAVLFSHDDVTPGNGSIRHTLNKAAAADTAALVLQDNWSGRAEIGLAGDDDLHIKVSPDGVNWREAVRIDQDSGNVSLPQGFDSQQIIVARDGVGTIQAPSKGGILAFSLVHEVYPQAHIAGLISYDCGASPFIQTLAIGTGVASLGAVVPTGTTGAAGKVGIGVDNAGHIYIENRSTHTTSPSQFSLTFFGGYRGI